MTRSRISLPNSTPRARGVVALLSGLLMGLAACPPPCPQPARPRGAACVQTVQKPPTRTPDCAQLCTYFTYCQAQRWTPPRRLAAQVLGCTNQCDKAKPGTPAQKIFAGLKSCTVNRSCVAMMHCLQAEEAKLRASKPQIDPDAIYRVSVTGSPARGPADALVTLVMFSDHECGFCRRAYAVVQAALKLHPKALRVVYKSFPLSNHAEGLLSARAAACVMKQRGAAAAMAFHDKAMVATDLSQTQLLAMAKAAGADDKAVAQCLGAKQGLAAVYVDRKLGESLGVDGTPAFYINGKLHSGFLSPAALAAAIAEARARAETAVKAGVKPAGVYDHLTAGGATKPKYLPPKRPVPGPRK